MLILLLLSPILSAEHTGREEHPADKSDRGDDDSGFDDVCRPPPTPAAFLLVGAPKDGGGNEEQGVGFVCRSDDTRVEALSLVLSPFLEAPLLPPGATANRTVDDDRNAVNNGILADRLDEVGGTRAPSEALDGCDSPSLESTARPMVDLLEIFVFEIVPFAIRDGVATGIPTKAFANTRPQYDETDAEAHAEPEADPACHTIIVKSNSCK